MFTTQSGGGGFALPDGRLWELVSPPNKYGAGIEPLPREGVVEAAEDGSAITYLANGPIVASSAGNPSPYWPTQVLSRREAGGWSSQDIVSPSSTVDQNTISGTEYLYFSPDLSHGLIEPPGDTPLSPEATEKTVYARNDATGGYLPLVTTGNIPEGVNFGASGSSRGEQVHGLASTPDFSHILLESELPLTRNAPRETAGAGGSIYEWADGRLELVSELPDGTPSITAVLGARSGLGWNTRQALSSNGSRVFWTSQTTGGMGPLYMHEATAGRTVQVDMPAPGVAQPPASKALYELASVTGSKVFFRDDEPLTSDSKLPSTDSIEPFEEPDLYVYDTETQKLTDLTADWNGSEPADVQDQVLGASEDGSIVYFVATGALANGAKPGEDNLYVVSETGSTWSAPRFIAALSSGDGPTWQGTGESGPAAKVSPNGRFLAFMSDRSLTGYENRDVVSGAQDEEVFLYDEASEHLMCVSCNPTGARPSGIFDEGLVGNKTLLSDRSGIWGGHWLAADIPTWDRVGAQARLPYQARYLTDAGRMFFNSFDALVPQDTNGKADVYEYEPEHVGSCARLTGCVSLISSGTSSEESTFLDASGMGPGGEEAEDVFFLTTSRLTTQDYDSGFDVYDAHVCSSAVPCVPVPVSPPECTSGDSCKAAPSPQPAIFGAPASATFSGTGNLPSPPPPVVTSKKHAKKKPVKHPKRRKRSRKARRSRAGKGLSAKTGDAGKGRGR
jgi:hypothetical protein